jgi:ammonium transporter, Amt family
MSQQISAGDTAWVLVAAAMVLLMTPGLAFLYGGMTRAKSTLNMMMMSLVTIGIVTALWVIFGYSLAFGHGGGIIGPLSLSDLGSNESSLPLVNGPSPFAIPVLAFAAFQLTFAVITTALISGSIADRTKFISWCVFAGLWATLVYFPIAHWSFDFGDDKGNGAGWLAGRGLEDFAGGTVVEINSGIAGLAMAIVLGKRIGWRKDPMRPHNVPLVLIGAGLLWFGWFGFNAGSALGANHLAALAFMNTQIAGSIALLGWLVVEKYRDGKPTSLGAASGAVAGLVAITPACAFVSSAGAAIIGLLAGVICSLAIGLKYRLGYDDSLDVVGLHGVGGIIGTLAIGFFGTKAVNSAGKDGLFYGGGAHLLSVQALAVFAVIAYSFVVTFAIGKFLDKSIGMRISRDDEIEGVDLTEHAETGYEFDGRGGGGAAGALFSGHS